jgi:endonuclease-3
MVEPDAPATYTLLVAVPEASAIAFGAAGEHAIGPGWATYTGSAFGPGGLRRIDRHAEIARGEREVRHWHVDHLLGHAATRLAAAWVSPREDAECRTHRQLPGREVPVGASDCTCEGHVRLADDREQLVARLATLHRERWPLER